MPLRVRVQELVPDYRIGTLQLSDQQQGSRGTGGSGAGAGAGNEMEMEIDPLGAVYSAFPSERFDGTGLEAFRFQWAASDWLLRRDPLTGKQRPPTEEELWHVHRAKSHVSPLDYDRDWLHVAEPSVYAEDMLLKEALLTSSQSRPLCYVTTPESQQAEQEVLDDVIEWCCRRYPDRFSCSSCGSSPGTTSTVSTHTAGYERTFVVSDYADEPLRLAGMLVQEDFYLLVEDDVDQTTTPSGMDYHRPSIPGYDQQRHEEDHPTGKHHVFTASASCFSIDAVDKHMRPMSSIHAPYVPGWDLQLQKHMNRLFTHMTPDAPVYRHNFNFTYKDAHTGALLHENPWSPVALPHLIEQAEAEGLERANTKAAAKKTGKEIRKRRLEEEGASFVEEELELLCEYQTLRRMRTASNFILFTVRTYINPFANLLQAPAAAQAMAAAIRRKHRGRLHNRGVGTEGQLRGLLEFLDTTTAAAGLETGLGDGVLPAEPVRVRPIDVQLLS